MRCTDAANEQEVTTGHTLLTQPPIHPNRASFEANQDSPTLTLQLSHLLMGHLLNFYFLNFKNYSWFKDSTHCITGQSKPTIFVSTNKNANVPAEPGRQHTIFFYIW